MLGPQTLTYDGTLTALTSIAHGGRDSGTVHGFRRETLLDVNGRQMPGTPVISGSVIRGSLRRTAAKLMQAVLAEEGADHRLAFHHVHALTTGGSLTETRTSGEVLNVERQAVLRDLVPMLAIFGVAGGGRILSGKLSVDKGIPIATETAFLGEVPVDYELSSIWSLVAREPYSRVADVLNGSAAHWVAPSDETQLLAPGAGQMKWAQESLLAGTRIWHSLTFQDVTPVEASFIKDLLKAWSKTGGKVGAMIGGQKARGHGRVRVDYDLAVTDVLGDPVDLAESDWLAHVAEHRGAAREALGWL